MNNQDTAIRILKNMVESENGTIQRLKAGADPKVEGYELYQSLIVMSEINVENLNLAIKLLEQKM